MGAKGSHSLVHSARRPDPWTCCATFGKAIIEHQALVQGQGYIRNSVLTNPRIAVAGKNHTEGNVCSRNRKSVVGRLCTARLPIGVRDIAWFQKMTMHKPGFRLASIGAGSGVEQPFVEFDFRRLRKRWVDAHFLPQFQRWDASRREASGCTRRGGSPWLPTGGGAGTGGSRWSCETQWRSGYPSRWGRRRRAKPSWRRSSRGSQGRAGLDFQDGAAFRAEAVDLCAAVGGGELLGSLPVVEVAAHERSADRLGGAALLDDDRIELKAAVNWEDLVAVLDAEQPLHRQRSRNRRRSAPVPWSEYRPEGTTKPRRPPGLSSAWTASRKSLYRLRSADPWWRKGWAGSPRAVARRRARRHRVWSSWFSWPRETAKRS